jgi:hypothetical protein
MFYLTVILMCTTPKITRVMPTQVSFLIPTFNLCSPSDCYYSLKKNIAVLDSHPLPSYMERGRKNAEIPHML